MGLIAEIKRATPSSGDLNVALDAAATARAFGEGGAAAISVLTEPHYFKGSLEDLVAARGAGLPVLRKDFLLDTYQVLEARAFGADAVLVIVRLVPQETAALIEGARAFGMDALVEVFDEADLEVAIDAGATLIGINRRDLATFEVDPERTAKLAPLIPDGCTTVALSGVSTRADIQALRDAGVDAVLVGSSLVTASDVAAKVRELVGS